MKVVHYSEDLYSGNGEGFLHSNPECALSFFRSPNNNKLKGIGLHVHQECDDIDILLKGELTFLNSNKSFKKVQAPCIVANTAGIHHAVIATSNQPALMYGFRSPFKGGEPICSLKGESKKNPQMFFPNKYESGVHFLFDTPFTTVFLHVDQKEISKRDKEHSRTILNIGSESVQLSSLREKLGMGSAVIDESFDQIEINESASLLVELIAKRR